MVAVRLRPMWKKEKEKGEISIVKIMVRYKYLNYFNIIFSNPIKLWIKML
jgi:hypothetical protein